MREKSSIAPRLPEVERRTQGEDDRQSIASAGIVGKLEAIRRRMEAGPDPSLDELDAVVAPWFDAAVAAWGKATSYAATLGIGEAHLSAMRAGKKAIPLRALLPLLSSREAVQRFCAPLCDAVGLEMPMPARRVSRDEIVEAFMRSLLESPPLLRLMVGEAARAFGVSADEVLGALGGK